MSKTPIEMMLEGVEWVENAEQNSGNSDLPHVTYSGVLEIAGTTLRCYQLSNGERVFDADDIERLFA